MNFAFRITSDFACYAAHQHNLRFCKTVCKTVLQNIRKARIMTVERIAVKKPANHLLVLLEIGCFKSAQANAQADGLPPAGYLVVGGQVRKYVAIRIEDRFNNFHSNVK